MANPPDWAARWLERESRVVDAIEVVALLDRLPRTWLIGLLHAAGMFVLLLLGVVANGAVAWAVLAVPMTMIVVLALAGRGPSRTGSTAFAERNGPFDRLAMEPSVVEPSFDSPIVVIRRTHPALITRRRR